MSLVADRLRNRTPFQASQQPVAGTQPQSAPPTTGASAVAQRIARRVGSQTAGPQTAGLQGAFERSLTAAGFDPTQPGGPVVQTGVPFRPGEPVGGPQRAEAPPPAQFAGLQPRLTDESLQEVRTQLEEIRQLPQGKLDPDTFAERTIRRLVDTPGVGDVARGSAGAVASIAEILAKSDTDLRNRLADLTGSETVREADPLSARTLANFLALAAGNIGPRQDAGTLGEVGFVATRSLTSLAVASPGGLPAIVGTFMEQARNQALRDGQAAGLSGDDLTGFANREGMIEGGITLAFSLAGLGGLERTAPIIAIKGGIKAGLKRVGKDILHEIPEEGLIETVSTVNRGLSGVEDLSQLTPQEIFDRALVTTLTAAASVGGRAAATGASNLAADAAVARERAATMRQIQELEASGGVAGVTDIVTDADIAAQAPPAQAPAIDAQAAAQQALATATVPPQPDVISVDGVDSVFRGIDARERAEAYAESLRQTEGVESAEVTRIRRDLMRVRVVMQETAQPTEVQQQQETTPQEAAPQEIEARPPRREATPPGDLAEVNRKLRRRVRSLKIRAFRDPLTKVGNRRMHDETLSRLRKRQAETGETVAVIRGDLANLKAANDLRSTEGADALLQQAAQRLESVSRQGDVVARVGGDEFALILPNTTVEAAAALRDRAEAAVGREQLVEGVSFFLSAEPAIIRPGMTDAEVRAELARADAEASRRKEILKRESGEVTSRTAAEARVARAKEQKHADQASETDIRIAEPTNVLAETVTEAPSRMDTSTVPPAAEPLAAALPADLPQALTHETRDGEWSDGVLDNLVGGRSVGKSAATAWQRLSTLVDIGAPLDSTEAGQQVRQTFDRAESTAADLRGPLTREFSQAWRGAGRRARKWLGTVRPDGMTNLRAAVEAHLLPGENPMANAPKGAAAVVDAVRKAQQVLGQRAEAAAVAVGKGKQRAAFTRTTEGRLWRNYTPEAQMMFELKSGEVWDAFVGWLQANPDLNPDLPTNPAELRAKLLSEEGLAQRGKPGNVRQDHSLTHLRVFRAMPDSLVTASGRRVWLTDPSLSHSVVKSIDSQARTVALIEEMGNLVRESRPFEPPRFDPERGFPLDEAVDRWRRHVAETSPGRGQPGDPVLVAFNDVLDAYTNPAVPGIAGELGFLDVRGPVAKSTSALVRNIKAGLVALSPLYDIVVLGTAVNRLGVRDLGLAIADVVRNPKHNYQMMRYLDAVHEAGVEFTLRRGDMTFDLLGRVLPEIQLAPAKASETITQTILARATQRMLQRMNGQPVDLFTRDLLKSEFRMTDAEVDALQAGALPDAAIRRAIRAGVAVGQPLAEQGTRRGKIQRNSLLRSVFVFASYWSGVSRAQGRAAARVGRSMQRLVSSPGDREAQKFLARALLSFLLFQTVVAGQGFVNKYLRRAVTRQPLRQANDPQTWAGTVVDLWFEGGLLGISRWFSDLYEYGGSSAQALTASLMPTVTMTMEMVTALVGWGKYEGVGFFDRVGEVATDTNKIVQTIKRNLDAIAYPAEIEHRWTRNEARRFLAERDKDLPPALRRLGRKAFDRPRNEPSRKAVTALTRDADPTEIKRRVDEYFEFTASANMSRDEALKRIRASALRNRPLAVPEQLRDDYLKWLDPAARARVLQADKQYLQRVNQWLPTPTSRQALTF